MSLFQSQSLLCTRFHHIQNSWSFAVKCWKAFVNRANATRKLQRLPVALKACSTLYEVNLDQALSNMLHARRYKVWPPNSARPPPSSGSWNINIQVDNVTTSSRLAIYPLLILYQSRSSKTNRTSLQIQSPNWSMSIATVSQRWWAVLARYWYQLRKKLTFLVEQ